MIVGCASAPKVETITAFRSFDVPSTNKAKAVVDAAKSAMLRVADNLSAIISILPDPLPETPGNFDVGIRNISIPFGGNVSFLTVLCPGAPYAVISNSSGFAGGGSAERDQYTGCIYAYTGGLRVHIVMIRTTKHASGLQGMVNQTVMGMIRGGNDENLEAKLDLVAGLFKNTVTEARLVKSSVL
jgi:hypothetical protein